MTETGSIPGADGLIFVTEDFRTFRRTLRGVFDGEVRAIASSRAAAPEVVIPLRERPWVEPTIRAEGALSVSPDAAWAIWAAGDGIEATRIATGESVSLPEGVTVK